MLGITGFRLRNLEHFGKICGDHIEWRKNPSNYSKSDDFTKKGDVNLDKFAIGVPYQDKTNVGRYSDRDLRDRGNIWFIPYEAIWDRSQRPHPSTFPVKLPEMCIELHGIKKGTVVLDPFIGTGSTAIAALQLGASCIGFDIDKKYLEFCFY